MNDVKISVIVPCYNVATYLKQCLDSILTQTFKNIEIICINDGSTDQTLNIIQQYTRKDDRIRVFNEKNGGYGKAVNKGLYNALGDYIAIVEPDDFIESQMYEYLYNLALKYPKADIIKSSYYNYYDLKDSSSKREIAIMNHYMKPPREAFSIKEYPDILYHHPSIWSAIYKNSFLKAKNIKFVEAPGAGWVDNPFFFETLCQANSIVWTNRAFYNYRQTNPEASSNLKNLSIPFLRLQEIYNFIAINKIMDERILCCLYKRTFQYIRKALSSPNYQKESVEKLIEKIVAQIDVNILQRNSFSDDELECLQAFNQTCIDNRADDIEVSVIVAVYNTEKYLKQCIESICQQTLRNIEIILVDDGSTDDSLYIMRKCERMDCRIRVLTQKNCGAGAARNYGLEIARGKYLSFLDSDDFFAPNMLEELFNGCENHHVDISIVKTKAYDNVTGIFSDMPWVLREERLPARNPFSYKDIPALIFNIGNGWAWDKLFRTEMVRNNNLRFQEIRTSNDMFFVFSAFICANGIYIIKKQLAFQRVNQNSSLSVTREKSWKCFYEALIKLKSYLDDRGLYNELEKSYLNWAIDFTKWNFDTLSGISKIKVYDLLTTGGFYELGINEHTKTKLYKKEYLEFYEKIMNQKTLDYLYENWNSIVKAGENNPIESNNILLQTQKLAALSKSYEDLQKRFYDMENSISFRIGRYITWLPRRIRFLIKHY